MYINNYQRMPDLCDLLVGALWRNRGSKVYIKEEIYHIDSHSLRQNKSTMIICRLESWRN